jgi:thiol-disulfide isomerase/thioredoxin
MRLFFTLLSLLPFFTFGQSINYTISGKFVKSEPDFKKLYIGRDSVTLNSDHTFSYSGMLETAGSVYLLADKNSSNEEIWVNGGNINISLEEYVKPGQTVRLLKIDSVKGSKETEVYQYLHDSLIKLSAKFPKRNMLGIDSMKLGYFQLVKNYVENNKNSYFSAMLTSYSAFTLDQKRDLLKIIKNNPAFNYVEALETSIKQMELLKPGNKISDFTQPSTDGKPVSLYSLKSRFVLIQFWASWCATCRWENPQLIKLYSKYHPDGNLDIVDISLDTDSSDWKEAIAKDHLPWINVCDFAGWQNLLVQKYILTPHVPFSILIDSSHSIVASEIWPSQLGDILQKNLGK